MLKTNKSTKILAINSTTRYLGIAVFENHELIYYKVKTIKSPTLPKLLKKSSEIIQELIFTYHPDLVVQEKLFYVQCQDSEKLKKLAGKIKSLVKRLQVDYLEYSPNTVRQQICQNDQATKKETFKIIASLYPELAANLTDDKPWKDNYWKHLLAAVALGVCCWQNLN